MLYWYKNMVKPIKTVIRLIYDEHFITIVCNLQKCPRNIVNAKSFTGVIVYLPITNEGL